MTTPETPPSTIVGNAIFGEIHFTEKEDDEANVYADEHVYGERSEEHDCGMSAEDGCEVCAESQRNADEIAYDAYKENN